MTVDEGITSVGSKQNRRKFLKAASGLLAAPFLSFRAPRARAAGAPPLRLMTIMDSYGVPTTNRGETWIDSAVGDYALTNDSLGTILAPLSSYRDNMLVISGLRLDSAIVMNDAATHDRITGQTLTGSRLVDSVTGSAGTQHHASVDVHIGKYLSDDYGLTFPRIYSHLFLSDYSEASKTTFCFNEQGSQIRSISGVGNIVGTLFGSSEDANAVLLDTRAQQLALDLVHERLQSVRGELVNANAATVMDAYESSVDELATELELRANLQCTPPDITGAPDNGARNASSTPFIFASIYQAFACDLASSITYAIGGETINQLKYQFLYDQEAHNDESLLDLLKKNFHAASHRNDPAADKAHELVRTYQAGLLAELLDKMSTTPDIDGSSTMLDNTVIFVTSAMSNNTHKRGDYCHLLLAGSNTNLRGGFHYDCSGSTNNDLLTTIAGGLTLPDTSFGGYDASGTRLEQLNHGPITKMLKA